MKTKENFQKQIEELQLQIKELENQSFQTIKYNSKEFRIYKWEGKHFGDFQIPKGYDWAEYFDVVNLINEKKLKFTKPWAEVYICKNQFKKNENKYPLSGLYLDYDSSVNLDNDYLDNSSDNGRVVLVKLKEAKQ